MYIIPDQLQNTKYGLIKTYNISYNIYNHEINREIFTLLDFFLFIKNRSLDIVF